MGGGFLFQRVICFTYHIFMKKTRPAESKTAGVGFFPLPVDTY